MKRRSRFYPRVQVDTNDVPAVGQAGGVLLPDTVAAVGLDATLSRRCRRGASRWRSTTPEVVLDLTLTLALGGDCLADIALLRVEPGSTGGWPRT